MDIKTDTPMTLATIQSFRQMLDVMEEFIKNTELERLETEKLETKNSGAMDPKECRGQYYPLKNNSMQCQE